MGASTATLGIRRLKHLACRLHFPVARMQEVARDIEQHYIPFSKHIGSKRRRLFNPSSALRAVLTPLKALLRTVTVPPCIIGGREGGTLRAFAQPHACKPWVLKLDIRSFYPSVSYARVYRLFDTELCCGHKVAPLLTRLTTAEGHLPQGFNTSTDIGNLVIRRCAQRLAGLAVAHGCDFTVWVDNMILSGPEYIPQLEEPVPAIVESRG